LFCRFWSLLRFKCVKRMYNSDVKKLINKLQKYIYKQVYLYSSTSIVFISNRYDLSLINSFNCRFFFRYIQITSNILSSSSLHTRYSAYRIDNNNDNTLCKYTKIKKPFDRDKNNEANFSLKSLFFYLLLIIKNTKTCFFYFIH